MKFARRTSIAIVALASLMGQLGQSAAFAGAGSAVATGTITPGLTNVCTDQTSVIFNSALLVYADTSGPTVSATGNATFAGASTLCETLTSGQGIGNLSGSLSGTIRYVRTGNLVALSGTINDHGVIAAACVWVPLSINPVRSAGWYCVWVTAP